MGRPDAATRPAGAPAGVFLGTFALILLVMGALFAIDRAGARRAPVGGAPLLR